MGAELQWLSTLEPAVIRFGPKFTTRHNHDPYAGVAVIEGRGGLCIIGPLAGQMTTEDHDGILRELSNNGFREARVDRRGHWFSYDLVTLKRRRID